MAKKRIDIAVKDPTFGEQYYRGEAFDQSGTKVAYAYEKTRDDARRSVIQKVRSMYGQDAEIIY